MKILEKIKHLPLLAWFLISTLLLCLLFIVFNHIYPHFQFTPALNITIGWIIFALDTMFFTKGILEYKKTGDKRMALFACGFLIAGLFEITHTFHSDEGKLQLAYASLANFSYAVPGIASLFCLHNPIAKDKKFFFANVLALNLIFFGAATFLMELLVTQELADKIYSLNGTEMLYAATYLVIAIIYADARKSLGLSSFSFFSLGYFFLFLNEIAAPTGNYLSSSYRLFVHFEMILGIIFILIGLKNIQFMTENFSTKLKSYISPYLYLVAIYILILLLSSDAFNVLMPKYIQFYFLMFFIILMLTDTKESDA